jgi:replication-associated recombination protein RarA
MNWFDFNAKPQQTNPENKKKSEELYRPVSQEEFLPPARTHLKSILKNIHEDLQKTFLLEGEPGLGKTSIGIYLALHLLNLKNPELAKPFKERHKNLSQLPNLVYYNFSSRVSVQKLQTAFEQACQMEQVNQKNQLYTVFLVDEIDPTNPNTKPTLIKLAEIANLENKFLIVILTLNDKEVIEQNCPSLQNLYLSYHFAPLSKESVFEYTLQHLKELEISIDESEPIQFLKAKFENLFKGDIRKIQSHFRFWNQVNPETKLNSLNLELNQYKTEDEFFKNSVEPYLMAPDIGKYCSMSKQFNLKFQIIASSCEKSVSKLKEMTLEYISSLPLTKSAEVVNLYEALLSMNETTPGYSAKFLCSFTVFLKKK